MESLAGHAWADLGARLLAAIESEPARVPVVVGADHSGRTAMLHRLAGGLPEGARQFVDLERVTSTPERFLAAILRATPFTPPVAASAATGAAASIQAFLDFIVHARSVGDRPATFFLDEWLELRTFEHFPGLRRIMRDVVAALAASSNRFVLTSRFVARTLRLLEGAPDRLMVVSMPPLTAAAVAADLLHLPGYRSDAADEFAHTILALTGGHAGHARALVDTLAATPAIGDPVSALVASLAPGSVLDERCRATYHFRLHRARGYGALKAVLAILAAEEPLNLTDIALRLGRTPGSTRDYLWWLEDVDLIVSHRKQYTFADPILRLWVGLFDAPAPAGDDTRAAAIQRYALSRLSASPRS